MTLAHELSISPTGRTIDATFRADLDGRGAVDLTFPVWTPGSYLVREHERHVHELTATADGRPVEARKVAKNVYRLETAGARRLEVRFEVYAHELTVRTSHVDPSHAFLNPVTFAPFIPGREDEPQELAVRDLPAGWAIACALAEVRPNTFRAKDYDELVDSPLECGPHAEPNARRRFTVRGVPHELVFWGRSSLDEARFVEDCAKIGEAHAALFGGLPYPRHLGIVHATDAGRGGLEHRASAALLFSRASLHQPRGYEELIGLYSHELFHAWNVKSIRPEAFSPYDFSRECHTRELWAFEGLTSYYEDLALVRAGLMTRARFLERLGEDLTSLARNPGRLRHSLADASYDAWIRYYRQDENWNQSSVSYYLKGALVGALVDLEIRRRTGGERSLDDAMRKLYRENGLAGRPVPEGGVEAACEAACGSSLAELFDLALRSTRELPFDAPLASHGLRLARRAAHGPEDCGGTSGTGEVHRCDIGQSTRNEAGRLKVTAVRRGSPAEAGGVCPGDELVALDGLRVDTASFSARMHERAPGTTIRLTLFRRDELVETSLETAPALEEVVQVLEAADASDEAKALFAAWLGRA